MIYSCPVQSVQDDSALWPRGLVPAGPNMTYTVTQSHFHSTWILNMLWLFFSTPGTLHPCHLLGTLLLSTFNFMSCMNCGENDADICLYATFDSIVTIEENQLFKIRFIHFDDECEIHI